VSSLEASAPVERQLESHRRSLTGYCYRMLGSGADAEDAVQETMVRAWRSADKLQSPAALKSWLYRIASNVCFDALDGTQRRAQPMDLGPASTADAALAQSRETLRLAFVAALQHLPARQRAVLILREVLRWQASEVAELLDTSVASVNSALQRARATIDSLDLDTSGPTAVDGGGGDEQELLSRYVDAFERYDIDSLVALLHEDATFSMPPLPLWLDRADQVAPFMLGPGAHCEGSKLLVTSANGGPAVGIYHPVEDGYESWAIVLVEMSDGRISGLHHFLFAELFAEFGLPPRLALDA
jgi:RNA polymerase sigma-70 factor (ECF subfamily)